MAVYTPLSNEEISQLLEAHYALGALDFALGIAQGVENTNYLIAVRGDDGEEQKYILTLFEKRTRPEDIPFFMALMAHLQARGVVCPEPVQRRDGGVITQVKGKASVLVSFLHGKSRNVLRNEHLAALGAVVAGMHKAVEGFAATRPNSLSLAGWERLTETLGDRLNDVRPGLAELVRDELAFLRTRWPQDLPRGVVHADIFPDNVFFDGDAVSGVIDFYFACEDFFAYDLMIVMNAWCFEGKAFNLTKAQHLLRSYEKVRALTEAERDVLPVLARGAALRFLLTRAHDLLHHEAGALVTPKDPLEYVAKLEFHHAVTHAGAYGL